MWFIFWKESKFKLKKILHYVQTLTFLPGSVYTKNLYEGL